MSKNKLITRRAFLFRVVYFFVVLSGFSAIIQHIRNGANTSRLFFDDDQEQFGSGYYGGTSKK